MKSLPRPLIIAVIVIIVLTTGILLLIRTCIYGKGFGGAPAGMREQFASAPALFLEKNGKAVILSILQHQKIHTYSRRGNMVQKSVSTTYYLQTNDAATANKIAEVKLKSTSDIKSYPVEVMGTSGSVAWIFAGEPMAFDAFTLEKKADIRLLEATNKLLAGKFPTERRYYQFETSTGTISFTAIDGTKWKLNANSFQASPAGEEEMEGSVQELLSVERAEKQNQADLDSLYQQLDRVPSKQYAAGEISYAEYNRISIKYREQRALLYKKRDSLREWRHRLQSLDQAENELERALSNLGDGNPNYTGIFVNQDTLGGNWFGLYSAAELRKLSERVRYQREYDETARRLFYRSVWKDTRPGNPDFDKEKAVSPAGQSGFLHGGFLLDKKTARPIHLTGNGFLVVHKAQIGNEGSILVSNITGTGQVVWNHDTQLTTWADWFYTGKRLVIMGTDNKDLSSGQVNVLLSIDINTGKSNRYDYYEDTMIKEK